MFFRTRLMPTLRSFERQQPTPAPSTHNRIHTMDTSTLIFAALTLCLTGATFHARRMGNERRDVVLLGVFSGLMGSGTAITAIL